MLHGMKKAIVWYHKDGDSLALVTEPWWVPTFEFLIHRIAPCCGLFGWLSSKSDKFSELLFDINGNLQNFAYKKQREIYTTPIESGCKASVALYGIKGHSCWKDECEYKEEDMPDL